MMRLFNMVHSSLWLWLYRSCSFLNYVERYGLWNVCTIELWLFTDGYKQYRLSITESSISGQGGVSRDFSSSCNRTLFSEQTGWCVVYRDAGTDAGLGGCLVVLVRTNIKCFAPWRRRLWLDGAAGPVDTGWWSEGLQYISLQDSSWSVCVW